MDRRVEPARSDNFARVSSSIAERIRGVCADWPEPEFEALVQHMAAIEVKFALRGDLEFLMLDDGAESDSPRRESHAVERIRRRQQTMARRDRQADTAIGPAIMAQKRPGLY